MTTAVPLSIIGLVLSFIIGALGLYPSGGVGGSSSGSTEGTSDVQIAEAADQAAGQFYSMYTRVLEDLASYQKSPEYQRAEEEQAAMSSFAKALLPKFQELTSQLSSELDQLTAEAAALEAASSDGTGETAP